MYNPTIMYKPRIVFLIYYNIYNSPGQRPKGVLDNQLLVVFIEPPYPPGSPGPQNSSLNDRRGLLGWFLGPFFRLPFSAWKSIPFWMGFWTDFGPKMTPKIDQNRCFLYFWKVWWEKCDFEQNFEVFHCKRHPFHTLALRFWGFSSNLPPKSLPESPFLNGKKLAKPP